MAFPSLFRSLGLAVLALPAFASSTAVWELSTWQDFIRGRFEGLSVSRDGRLLLAPKTETVFASGQPVIWSVAQGPDGKVYAGTGHRGRVYSVDSAGKSELLWTSDQPEIFAVTVDARGRLYAATSPDGKVYRIENGKAAEFFAPQSRYIWSLAIARNGDLFVGTGDQGKVFRVKPDGSSEVFFESGQSHITSLAIDAKGQVLAGSEPNGILYRISSAGKAFVLYDANLPEVRAILPMPDGSVYAAAMGGSVARRTQQGTPGGAAAPGGAVVSGGVTTITVTAEAAAQAAAEIKPADAPKPAPAAQPQAAATVASPVIDMPGVERSALYHIHPDNTVETLWSSKEENAYDLLEQNGALLFATDINGRVYRLTNDRKVTLTAQTSESDATRLLADRASILVATGNTGKLIRLTDAQSESGWFESPVHDASTVARWGKLVARGSREGVVFRTRTGNSFRPDKTWSDWSDPLPANGGAVTSPNARFIQWKAEFAKSGSAMPVLDSASVSYLPQNATPVVKTITVVSSLSATAAQKAAPTPPAAAYSITVSDVSDPNAAASAGTPAQTVSRAAAQQVVISWQAEDSDGDRLVYAISVRGEDEQEWRTLRTNYRETNLTLDGDTLADGRYFFRVTASDREANPPAAAREGELTSSPVLIDNTPPAVRITQSQRNGTSLALAFEAADSGSPVRRCEFSVNGGNWSPADPSDGVLDSLTEACRATAVVPASGEVVVTVRATDSANNAGMVKSVLR